jgi:hypothetical protein
MGRSVMMVLALTRSAAGRSTPYKHCIVWCVVLLRDLIRFFRFLVQANVPKLSSSSTRTGSTGCIFVMYILLL